MASRAWWKQPPTLTPAEARAWITLQRLAREGHDLPPTTALARALGVGLPAASDRITALVTAGLVRRPRIGRTEGPRVTCLEPGDGVAIVDRDGRAAEHLPEWADHLPAPGTDFVGRYMHRSAKRFRKRLAVCDVAAPPDRLVIVLLSEERQQQQKDEGHNGPIVAIVDPKRYVPRPPPADDRRVLLLSHLYEAERRRLQPTFALWPELRCHMATAVMRLQLGRIPEDDWPDFVRSRFEAWTHTEARCPWVPVDRLGAEAGIERFQAENLRSEVDWAHYYRVMQGAGFDSKTARSAAFHRGWMLEYDGFTEGVWADPQLRAAVCYAMERWPGFRRLLPDRPQGPVKRRRRRVPR